MKLLPLRRRRTPSRGQALAEFAIVLPVLMLVVGGLIQFGIVFWGQNTLTQVTRDTGRYASTLQTCATATVVNQANGIAGQSSLIGYSSGSPWTSSNVVVQFDAGCPPTSNQQVVYVTITIHHRVPILFPWVPGNGDLTSSATFRMEPVSQP